MNLFSRKSRTILLIAAFCMIVVSLIWLSLSRQLSSDKSQTIKTAISRNENLVVALEQYTIRTINNTDAVLQLVKMEYERLGEQLDLKKLISNNSINNNFFESIFVINEDGLVKKSDMEQVVGSATRVEDRPHFNYHISNTENRPHIGKPFVCSALKKTIIPISRRLNKADGSFGGIVVIHIEPKVFTAFYAEADLREYDLISLIALDGITYSRRTGSKESFGEDISKSPLFHYVKKNPVNSYSARDAIRGIPSYFSYRALKDYPIIATAGTSEKDVLSTYNRRAERDLFSAAVISVLVVLFSILVIFILLHRRKAQEKIRMNEEKYRSIVQNSHDAILLLDGSGKMKSVNPAASCIFGYPEKELCEKNFTDLIDPSDPFIKQCMGQGLPSSYNKMELLFVGKNTGRFLGEMVVSQQHDSENSMGHIVIIRDITDRKKAAEKRLAEQKYFQRKLTEQVIFAQEKEREVIGRELHDNVNQVLTMVKLYLEMAMNKQASTSEVLPKSIQHVMYCINEIRNLSRDLSAPTLGTKSLVDSVNALLDMLRMSARFNICFNYEKYEQPVGMDHKLAIYRILQEQMNNIIKHAGATEVLVSLSQQENNTVLTIKDNGIGFDLSAKRNGIGINNMMSRAKVLDGKVLIHSEIGKGCELNVIFPVTANNNSGEKNLVEYSLS